MYFSLFKKLCMTEKEKQKLGKEIALIIVAAGGIVTLSYAIYFIVDTLKKWY
jgi:predicted permease